MEYENGNYTRIILASKDSSENYTLQCIDSKERIEEIDSGQKTYSIADMQINNETADNSEQQELNNRHNNYSREELDYLQVLIIVCCMMILVIAILLTITLFLCLCLVVYSFTLVLVCLLII